VAKRSPPEQAGFVALGCVLLLLAIVAIAILVWIAIRA